ncbi:trypsin family protein [Mycolicibacterium hassiacum DSM 44199]|uniref:Trypsin family protein n=1 Tax=Mycolicibacterium hassiacum (strain DSM 44199 / CIP 105218 / JCM 12690 / 3849) TaxID=1122247 RepID=K5BFW6_MYCHD|nr:trypsin family protein [Mycolicibacterium hassiacum DSM 44199]
MGTWLVAIVVAIGGLGCARVSLHVEDPEAQHHEDVVPSVAPPDEALADSPVVAEAARSVVKVNTMAPVCQKQLSGSGVVIAPSRVMSAAHTVAGAETVTVSADGRDWPATVVSFDPSMDIAVLDVPGLPAPPLEMAEQPALTGTDALVLGYPGGGPLVATPARIREIIELRGPDIYNTTTVKREVYVIRGHVRQGDSGGPLIDLNNRVLGISFGAAVDDPETGFVLTARQIYSLVVQGVGATAPVATGACVG